MSPPRAPKARDGLLNLTGFEWRDDYLGRYVDAGCDGVLVGPGRTGELSDLAFLAVLPGLRRVSCAGGVVDCSDVARVPGLRELHLPVDYAGPLPLAELPDLETLSSPYSAAFGEGIASLTALRSLMVWFWPKGVDLDLLGPKPELTWLRVEMKRGAEVTASAFAHVPQLRELLLYDGSLVDSSGLAALRRLRVLRFYSTKVADLRFAGAVPELTTLAMENAGEVATLRPLAGHPSLEVLALAGRTFVGDGDFAPLFSIPKLRSVGIERGASNYSHKPAELRANFPPG